MSTQLEYEKPVMRPEESKRINPWLFVPVLYFMQFLPYGLVTSLFSAVYKSLGVDNVRITGGKLIEM